MPKHVLQHVLRLVTVTALAAACGPGDDDVDSETDSASTTDTDATGATDVSASGTGSSGTGALEPPPGCPPFEFPEFEGPYGQVYCEVYLGCFGEVGGREPGEPKATTIPGCLELTCGNGDVNLEGEEGCTYDADLGAQCLEALGTIADNLETQCPAIDDAWFPDSCGLAIECALP